MIPIYRAKKIDSDECVEGNLLEYQSNVYVLPYETMYKLFNNCLNIENFEIDPSTLAIHFTGMLDSEGNKIFASLDEDGKGGDNVNYLSFKNGIKEDTVIFNTQGIRTLKDFDFHFSLKNRKVQVTGIQE